MRHQWITVTVHPRAKREVLVSIGEGRFEAWVKAKPIEGQANKAIVALLHRSLQIPHGRLQLVKGWNHHHKTFRVVS